MFRLLPCAVALMLACPTSAWSAAFAVTDLADAVDISASAWPRVGSRASSPSMLVVKLLRGFRDDCPVRNQECVATSAGPMREATHRGQPYCMRQQNKIGLQVEPGHLTAREESIIFLGRYFGRGQDERRFCHPWKLASDTSAGCKGNTGSWMHAFSEILIAPPGVEILRVDEAEAA